MKLPIHGLSLGIPIIELPKTAKFEFLSVNLSTKVRGHYLVRFSCSLSSIDYIHCERLMKHKQNWTYRIEYIDQHNMILIKFITHSFTSMQKIEVSTGNEVKYFDEGDICTSTIHVTKLEELSYLQNPKEHTHLSNNTVSDQGT